MGAKLIVAESEFVSQARELVEYAGKLSAHAQELAEIFESIPAQGAISSEKTRAALEEDANIARSIATSAGNAVASLVGRSSAFVGCLRELDRYEG